MPPSHSAELTDSVEFIGKDCIKIKIHGSKRISCSIFARALMYPSSHSSTIHCHPVYRLFLSHSIFAMFMYYLIVPMYICSVFPSRPCVLNCFVMNE